MDKEKKNGSGDAVVKYDVLHSEKLGRYMVAAKDLSPDEIIFREDPIAVGPTTFETRIFCFACMRPLPGYQSLKTRYACTKCHVAPLCNCLCESSKGFHTARECDVFREKKELLRDNLEEVVRILLHLRLWLLKDDDNEAWSRLRLMEAHLKERRNTTVWEERKKEIVDVFRKFGFYTSTNDPDETLQWLCGLIDVNTFELRAPSGRMDAAPDTSLLRGLFPEAALMAHVCRCTAHITVDVSFHMCVYASVGIAAGQQITFNYTSALLGTIERQEYLQIGKYFRCECSACNDPLEDGSYVSCIICPRCKKDYVAIQKPHDKDPYGTKTKWQCQKCKRIYKGCLIKTAVDLSNRLIEELSDEDPKAVDNLIAKLSRTFHKNHFIMISLKQKALTTYRREMSSIHPQRKTLQKMLDVCKDMLEILEIVEPGISRLKGITLYEMHLPIAILANRAYASREITASELHARLEESHAHLKRALTMLLLEPPMTPEGQLAKRAMQEMRTLAQSVEDANALAQNEFKKQEMMMKRKGKNNSARVK